MLPFDKKNKEEYSKCKNFIAKIENSDVKNTFDAEEEDK